MSLTYIKSPLGRTIEATCNTVAELRSIFESNDNCFVESDYYLVCNGQRVCGNDTVKENHIYHVVPRLVGGKGGFGSMLRAIGAQIEKTTNHEACRDLSGRRMRDLNNEKKLREWVARQAEREREKEERRKARMERRRATPRHNFSDPNYDHQMSTTAEDIRDAVRVGLQNATSTSKPSTSGAAVSAGRKRKAKEEPDFDVKKASEWLGMDINLDDLSDSDSDSDSASCSGSSLASQPPSGSNGASTSQSSSTVPSFSQSSGTMPSSSQSSDNISSASQSEACTNEIKNPSQTDNSNTESKTLPESISTSESGGVASGDDQPKTETATQRHSLLTALDNNPPQEKIQVTPEAKPEIVEVDLDSAPSQEYLESLGLESLKAALLSRGLKCSGTLQDRAERLWAVKGLSHDQIPASFFPKPPKKAGGKKK